MAAGHCDPVVAVGVVGGEAAELVAGQLGGLAVVVRGLLFGGGAGQRPEFQQRAGRARAVQVAVGDDGAVVGALGAAVVGVEVLDELRAGGAERDGPGGGVAVGVAGIVEDVAERDPGWPGIAVSTGAKARTGSCRHDDTVARRASSGTAGPVLLGHHDPGGQVLPVEQLVLAAQQVVLAVAPRRFGVGAVAGAARRGPGEGLQVGPVHRQRPAGVLELLRDAGLEQVVADCAAAGRRAARPARPCRGRPRPGRRCARSAGRSAGAGRASSPRSRRAAAGHPRPARSAPGAPGSGARAGDRRRPGTSRPAGCGPSAAGAARRRAASPRSGPRRRRRR